MRVNYDFGGWATKNDLRCSDKRIIRKDAFKESDGITVPLVWQHIHDDPMNVLGHALLENRDEGVYAYCTFNETEAGQNAKLLVEHGDVNSLSIYANKLKQKGNDVLHGVIREVSLVLSGANPGAVIDYPSLAHGEDGDDTEAIISIGYMQADMTLSHSQEDDEKEEKKESTEDDSEKKEPEEYKEDEKSEEKEPEEKPKEEKKDELEHEDKTEDKGDEKMADDKTIKDVFDELTEEQQNVVYYMIGQALEDAGVDIEDESEGDEEMKHNVFDAEPETNVLSHADVETIFRDAKSCGSLKEAVEQHLENGVLAHAEIPTDGMTVATGNQTYGFNDPDMLFPEYKNLNNPPEWLSREMDWVTKVINGTHHTPFSRIKSTYANITEDDARARGYIKGKQKKEEVFTLLKRTTDPQTIYKKQKLDRDDIIDITDFDVVAWIKAEMRIMLDEELARAILISDGRPTDSDDKIKEDRIRPIATDVDLFNIKADVDPGNGDVDLAKNFIDTAIRSRKSYKGSGNPKLFTTADMLTEMLLLEDGIGHKLYKSTQELATALRVSEIVEVEPMEGKKIEGKDLLGIIVNLNDYNVGADKGGATEMFDDFDIDFNQYKYLIETRCSGALIKPFSAITLTKANA